MIRKDGFTLIELLIVIAIIGILSGVLLVVINPLSIQQKARDAKRMQDMDTLKSSILWALADNEISLVETGTPCSADGCDQTEGLSTDGTNGYVMYTLTGTRGLAKFIPTLPADPLSTGTYIYASDGVDFELNSILEHADNISRMAGDGGDDNAVYEVGTALDIL